MLDIDLDYCNVYPLNYASPLCYAFLHMKYK